MLKNLYQLLAPALIVALHWYTGWEFILYLYGLMYAISSLVIAFGIGLVLNGHDQPKLKKLTKFQKVVSICNSIMLFSYFLYTSSYILATLLVVALILVLVLHALCVE